MTGKWKEVVRLTFKIKRFHDHALDLRALSELSQFQKMVAETAKSLWRTANPDRERLPHHFEERVRLCLRRIEDGSATAPLEVFMEEQDQTSFIEQEPFEINKAVELAYKVYEAISIDGELPQGFPKSLLPEYTKWGQTLADDESVELKVTEKQPAYLTATHRQKLETFSQTPHEDLIEITGEVFEADVRKGRFQLCSGEDPSVTIGFTTEQEDQVTTALKDHNTIRMHVKGLGEFSAQGTLLRVLRVDELGFTKNGEIYDQTARPIEELLNDLAKEIPEEEWDRLPDDLNDNLDYYLYGVPKK
jgi:hypothetical protein